MRLLIIGAGHAGGRLAAALIELGFVGSIDLVGEEPEAPYERPSLSKRDLVMPRDEIGAQLLKGDTAADPRLRLRLATRLLAIDADARRAKLSDGTELAFDACVLATGVSPRRLSSAAAADDLLYLRSAADCRRLRSTLSPNKRLCIIGGGFIGLEVASSAVDLGCKVALLEAGPRLLARAVSPAISSYVQVLHEVHGVDVRTGAAVSAVEGSRESGFRVTLDNGDELLADTVLVGIGSTPNDRLAADAGLACDDGVLVDASLRASRPGFYAVGDVARVDGVRTESWANAQHHALMLASALCGQPIADECVPWFWTDQHGINLQLLGTLPRSGGSSVVRDAGDGRFAIFHLDQAIVAAELINLGGERRAIERLITDRVPVDVAKLADPKVRLRTLIAEPKMAPSN